MLKVIILALVSSSTENRGVRQQTTLINLTENDCSQRQMRLNGQVTTSM